jgi:hypothetical protein
VSYCLHLRARARHQSQNTYVSSFLIPINPEAQSISIH